jgi:Zn-dependent protease
MYRDSFQETGFQRFLRTLSASFRLGRFFRVEVRVYWLALIITPLVIAGALDGWPFAEGAIYVAIVVLALFTVVWTHEMGHIVAGRRFGIDTSLITLSPLGGLAHMSSGATSPDREIAISLAGPATHLLWLAVFFPLSLVLDDGQFAPAGWWFDPVMSLVDALVWMNAFMLAFNLLPCFPMDGGRTLRAFLARRMHPNRATLIAVRVGTIGGIVFLVAGAVMLGVRGELWGPILIAIGISNIMACKQEKLSAQHSGGPYMSAENRQAWQTDPDAWKQQGGDVGGSTRLWESEKDARKREKRRAREAAAEAAFEAELDRVLARVGEVGMDGLGRKDRAILEKASERRRKR